MLIVGLTGGIGSGKSAASAHFEALNIKVVDADVVAREVVEPGQPALATITEEFGEDILDDQGALNRTKLRSIIFNDTNAKLWLEALLHPLIRSEILRQLSEGDSPYAILVSPLLFEAKQHLLCTRTLLIDCSVESQIKRASSRDSADEESIAKIIAAQMPRKEKQARADDVILNESDLAALHSLVDSQHQRYLALCT